MELVKSQNAPLFLTMQSFTLEMMKIYNQMYRVYILYLTQAENVNGNVKKDMIMSKIIEMNSVWQNTDVF